MLGDLDFSKRSCGFELASTIFIELYERTDQLSELASIRINIWTLNQPVLVIMEIFLINVLLFAK